MEFIKSLIFILASVVMEIIVILAPNICDTVVFFYVSILTGYIGLDIMNMIKTTSILPQGEFRPVKKYRYILCFSIYVVLLVTAGIIQHKTQIEMAGFYTVMVSAIFLLATLLIGGLEGNKFASKVKDGKAENKENEK